MSTVAFIRRCLAAGMTLDLAMSAAEAFEAEVALLPVVRSKGAIRQERYRARQASQSVTGDDCDAKRNAPHVGASAQVVTPSLPSLRSEEVKTPTEPNGSVAPKGAKTRGSKRVPAAWSPSQSTVAALEAEGHVAGDLERALTRMRDHEFRSPRTDWDAAFRNWVRTDTAPRKAAHERPHHDAKYAAKQDNLARHERGAELAARLYGDDG